MSMLTIIARVTDGLLLVASTDSSTEINRTAEIYRDQAKEIIKQLNPRSEAKCSIVSEPMIFHYLIEHGICYLTLSEKSYPKRLAFLYLEELHEAFVEELRRDYSEDWLSQIEIVSRPYGFIKFDKVIQRKRRDFLDPSSRDNMARLKNDLADIHDIMKKNIQEVLNRGEKLDHVSQISKNLASQAEQFKWNSKKLSLLALWQKYAPMAAIGIVV
eukprot:CAMPEP_0171473792 /NCGR_PEP_ID=MMETSP0946-20130122/2047_1 /TAXON_ID=109269 /ORGANISM="Vaucheria litorea, Strain CCMP2940" /LENGTH=214 /DNA_ID=CAMNT_0012003613 /DNA_START=148 /DNA_END=789 /DNA_ORIENTATION=+